MEEVIKRCASLPGVQVERCGSWLWISGKTYDSRAELKDAGCRFSHRKGMWYFHEGEYRKLGSRELSMDEIEEKYGRVVLV